MANYQRYQTLSAAEQNLFSPSCPVWVSRYQISWDVETGKRLIQVRMVNEADKTVRSVYLSIRCRDAQGQELTTLQMVPVPDVNAAPGQIFGDDRILNLWPANTSFAEVFVQRAVFSDGSAWNQEGENDYVAFPSPRPVLTTDPAYARLTKQAALVGAKNDYYFQSLRGVWTCTCGLPNGSRSLRCAHCGADRTWLEQNMDPAGPAEPPKPEPKAEPKPEPKPEPEPLPQTPIPVSPVPQYDLQDYLAVYPPMPVQPVMPQTPTEPAQPEEEPPKHSAGRTVAIVLAVLLFLGAAAYIGITYLMPFLRYREAVTEQAAGNYENAEQIFAELGDYEDSADRIKAIHAEQALALMRSGDYWEAYEALKDMEGYENYAADCIYSLGVLAYNAGELDKAWGYVQQLDQEFPECEKTEALRQCCCYSYGCDKMTEAVHQDDMPERVRLYREAQDWFKQAGEYQDSGDKYTECDYRIAQEQQLDGDDVYAVELFRALGDYKDSRERMHECMLHYAQQHMSLDDSQTMAYLNELIESGYDGGQQLMDQLTGDAFVFHVNESTFDTGSNVETADDLRMLFIHYDLATYGDMEPIRILVSYTLPNGETGTSPLNNDGSAVGDVPWSRIVPQDCEDEGTVTLSFYDASRGMTDPLEVIAFNYEPPEEVEEETAPPLEELPQPVGP